jgi:hypothetical protein
MKNFKNRINLDTNKLEELKTRTYNGIQSKYAPLLLNVIIANNNFPDELKDCILDHNMLEKTLLDCDFDFLVDEFGKDFFEFPKEFQNACIVLYEEFQKDFPNANDINLSIKNKVYGKNHRSPSNRFYRLSEFNEIRNDLRNIIVEFVNELGIVANLQSYDVYASCESYEEKYKLQLKMYVRENNKFPHIFESKPFSNPINQVDLKLIEQYYEWLSVSQKWQNEIDYTFVIQMGEEMKKYIPDFSLEYPVYNYSSSYKYFTKSSL